MPCKQLPRLCRRPIDNLLQLVQPPVDTALHQHPFLRVEQIGLQLAAKILLRLGNMLAPSRPLDELVRAQRKQARR